MKERMTFYCIVIKDGKAFMLPYVTIYEDISIVRKYK